MRRPAGAPLPLGLALPLGWALVAAALALLLSAPAASALRVLQLSDLHLSDHAPRRAEDLMALAARAGRERAEAEHLAAGAGGAPPGAWLAGVDVVVITVRRFALCALCRALERSLTDGAP